LILKESLEAKVGAFGDFSPEVAETYRFLSRADLAQGNYSGAQKKLKKVKWKPTLTGGQALSLFLHGQVISLHSAFLK
jgi:hypothetical protein